MAQTLLIGLGGTGGRVVNNVVKELRLNNIEINNGEMCCAVLDSNVNDNDSLTESNTGIPIIPISKAQKIKDYFAEYNHLNIASWCPQSPAFLEESMLDGCSELRIKSRLAFMDCVESGSINKLELMINEVLKNGSGSKIRVMIVSSLSGGTGSGMFIQTALWLRRILSESQITIRGIFLLPDVFVSTLADVRNNNATKVRHYCNAYAAIRELNAITKIKKSGSSNLPEQLTLGRLFDSNDPSVSGKPVFDFSFFVDDRDKNGVSLNSIDEYEKAVAQLVYMQLYAPMKDDMYSEEDNTFLTFVENDDPLYGSCGTAKAVYPTENIKAYCALRATQDSLTGGWKKIDDEIDALIKEREQAKLDGVFFRDVLDPRELFIKIFNEKISVKPEDAAKDRFFVSISKDIMNETKEKSTDGKITIRYSDKVEDFIKLIKSKKIDTVVTRCSGTEPFVINADAFVAEDHTKEELLTRVSEDESGLAEVLDTFDSKVDDHADEIVNSVFPYSMGDVKAGNECTIHGLLAKGDNSENLDFIHPVAARYVLYKLARELERELRLIALNDSRNDAATGGDIGSLFDNKATTDTEMSAEAFLDSKKWYQAQGTFLDDFEKRYADFITEKIGLCEKYEKECLQVNAFRKLLDRVNGLIEQMDAFFKKLNDVQKKLDETLAANIEEATGIVGKTIFVFSDKTAKQSIYESLDFNIERSNVRINESVINAIYGRLCAKRRPKNAENAPYLDVSVISAFVTETIKEFRSLIDSNENNKEIVDIDIFTALCRASDAECDTERENKSEADDIKDLDIVSGIVAKNKGASLRYREAFIACKDKLFRAAAPFLIHSKEMSNNDLGVITTRTKTFWGFSPEVVDSCPFLGNELGVNADLQMNRAYPKNELYCYRAVYGLETKYIPKFNELNEGDYFKCYNYVVSSMVKDVEGRQGERAYVRTPHIDKNWHRILPYVTEAKQIHERMEFFHGFWLAIAYGTIKADKDGNLFISRAVDGGFGNFIDTDIPIMYKDKQVTKTDVARLIYALNDDKVFSGSDIPLLNKRYADELENVVTYVGTDVLKGLTAKKEDLNPINIIARYNESRNHDKAVSSALIGALEMIAAELADKYNIERSEKQLEEAKYRICRKIYDSSKRSKGKSAIFSRWEQAFASLKIKGEDTTDSSSK